MAARRSASAAQNTGRRDQILAYLAQRGGRIESANGVGLTAAIADAVGYDDIGVLNGMLARLEQQGAIRREIRGRRTFAIELGKGTNRRKSSSSPSATAPARRNGRSSSAGITPFAEAATELVDQLASLRGTIDELASRVAALENGGSSSASAPATRRSSSKRGAAKRGAAKRGAAKRGASKRGAAKRGTAKRGTAKRATAKKTSAKRATAKKTTAKRATAKKTTARRATAKRGPAKKAAAKRAPARGRGRGAAASTDDRAAVRAWARSNGYAINDRGRLPREVIDAYQSAR